MDVLTRAARRPVLTLALVAAIALLAASCGGGKASSGSSTKHSSTSTKTSSTSGDTSGGGSQQVSASEVAKRADSIKSAPTGKLDTSKQYVVRVKTEKGSFDIRVDPKAGPIAANNFVDLVKRGFYDGVVFHRVIKDFMVQTGDPLGTGSGGPGYQIKDDPVHDPYVPGTVAMANSGPNTGGSQFFIVQGGSVQLPPDYSIFGHVDKAGMKVISAIADVPVGGNSMGEQAAPKTPIHIISATLVSGG